MGEIRLPAFVGLVGFEPPAQPATANSPSATTADYTTSGSAERAPSLLSGPKTPHARAAGAGGRGTQGAPDESAARSAGGGGPVEGNGPGVLHVGGHRTGRGERPPLVPSGGRGCRLGRAGVDAARAAAQLRVVALEHRDEHRGYLPPG